MKTFAWIILGVLGLGLLSLFGTCVRSCSNAEETAYKEFNASALLKKYEYFKDISSQLDKKVADLSVFTVKIKSLKADYVGKDRSKWARDDREQLSIWQSELDGMKASYNELAAQYNSAMSKFNYAFCNVGSLPKGAADPLPREFKPYIID
jgi:Tfp pilus assembly protein PilV